MQAGLGADLPLPAVVVVDADQVERLGRAAQSGVGAAAEQVPGLPLVAAHLLGQAGEVGPVFGRHDVHQRLDVHEARPRVDPPDGVDAGQRGAHQAALDVVAAVRAGGAALLRVAAVRMHVVRLGHRPGDEADLVDGGVDRRLGGVRREHVGGGRGVAREARHHRVVEQAHVGRRAVVHQRPLDLQAAALGGARAAQRAREVVAPRRRLGEPPADALAHRAQAEPRGGLVVLLDVVGVAVGPHHVERLRVQVDVVGALEAAHPERAEGRGGRRGGRRLGHRRWGCDAHAGGPRHRSRG